MTVSSSQRGVARALALLASVASIFSVFAGCETNHSHHVDAGNAPDGAVTLRDPWCLPGHDSEAPDLLATDVNVHLPIGFSQDIVAGAITESFDSGEWVQIVSFKELTPDGDATVELGDAVQNDDGTFEFIPTTPPTKYDGVYADGQFKAGPLPPDEPLTMAFVTPYGDMPIPLWTISIAIKFTTSEHCSMGFRLKKGPPSEWQQTTTTSAVFRGKLKVSDMRDLYLETPVFRMSACDEAAGSICENVPMEEWLHQPDTQINGEPAWAIEFSAAAVSAIVSEPESQ